VLLVLGWHARWAALVIFLYVIPVTLVFHPFWTDASQLWNFWKNVAIMGGMLYIMAYGPGPFSIDQRRR
jgi:putative oxidoreductase